MSSRTKNPEKQRVKKFFDNIQRQKREAERAAWLSLNVGQIVSHKDRVYKVQWDGSLRRVTAKHQIIRNSKNYASTI